MFQRTFGFCLKHFHHRSDNVTEGSIRKFIETHQQQLEGLVLTGMGHVTDMLFITCLPKTKVSLQRWTGSWEKSTDLLIQNLRVLAMGTAERISLKIQFEHLIAAIAQNCPHLERLEFRWATRQRESMSQFFNILLLFRWDREELRFSEKNQKAIDILRMSCLKLKSLVLCDRYLSANNLGFTLLDPAYFGPFKTRGPNSWYLSA